MIKRISWDRAITHTNHFKKSHESLSFVYLLNWSKFLVFKASVLYK